MKRFFWPFVALAYSLTAGISFAQLTGTSTPQAVQSYSLWSASTAPAIAAFGDPNAYEIGVKFYSDSSGFITAIRFYKGAGNSGTHIAHLWSSTGTLLSTAAFTNETASGWQQVTLPAPVPITAGSIYVASYWDPTGHYSLNRPYFTAQYNNPPLHALANGADGANGIYLYNNTAFPTSTYQSSNYWVDVVFTPNASANAGGGTGASTTAPTVSSISPAVGPVSGGTLVTINGSNFENGAIVSFGGAKAASVTFINPTQLQAVAPEGPVGAATVEVDNPDGGNGSLVGAFAYNQGPAVTSVSPISGPATGGTTVTITGSGFESGAMVAFGVTSATSVTVVSATEIQAVTPAESVGADAVTVTNSNSTIGTLPLAFTFLAGGIATGPVGLGGALLTGMTPSSYTVPSGWTMVDVNGFETGLNSGEGFYGGTNTETINCTFAHTGSCSVDTYVTNSFGGIGIVLNGSVINSREIYVSYWQYVQNSNPGYGLVYTDWYFPGRWLYINGSLDSVWPDWQSSTPAANPAGIAFFQNNGIASPSGPAPWAVYFGSWNELPGQWVQYEEHEKINDPGTDNGDVELYQNGVLMMQLNNSNHSSRCPIFNGQYDCGYWVGNQDFTTANLFITGDWGAVTPSGSNQNMASCSPASLCPPNGNIPYFHVYIDDVVVLKR